MEFNESDLIPLARAGDDVAWRRLVRAHQQNVFRLALLITSDTSDAEDVVQEVFLRACRCLNRFDTERPLQPWLLQITGRLARNRCRGRGRYLNLLARWRAAEPQAIWIEEVPQIDNVLTGNGKLSHCLHQFHGLR